MHVMYIYASVFLRLSEAIVPVKLVSVPGVSAFRAPQSIGLAIFYIFLIVNKSPEKTKPTMR